MTLTIGTPVEGEVFLELLTALTDRASILGLVTPLGRLDQRSDNLLAQLAPYRLESTIARSWPGSQVPDWADPSVVHKFIYNESVVQILFRSCQGLFRWQELALPVNLHLLDQSGEVVLGSTTSEDDAWLDVSLDSWLAIAESRPSLSTISVTLDD